MSPREYTAVGNHPKRVTLPASPLTALSRCFGAGPSAKPVIDGKGWLVGCCLLAFAAQAGAANATGDVRQIVTQWLAIERQHQKIASLWDREKPQLELRLQLLGRERDALKAAIASHSEGIDSVEQARESLLQEQQALEEEQEHIAKLNRQLQDQAEALLPAIPPPVADTWRERLPRCHKEDNPSTNLQCYLELFRQLEDFQQVITTTVGLISIPGGQTLQVRQFFLGATHAWYVSADGGHRGVGWSGPDGWVWREDSTLDPQMVFTAFEILENRGMRQLVTLPVRLENNDTSPVIAGVQRDH